MRLSSIIFLISFSIAQDMQVKYVVAYTIDVDWVGEIETVSEITAAPGYGKFNGQLNPKRWIFRIFGGLWPLKTRNIRASLLLVRSEPIFRIFGGKKEHPFV